MPLLKLTENPAFRILSAWWREIRVRSRQRLVGQTGEFPLSS